MELDKAPNCLKHQQYATNFICTNVLQHLICQKCIQQTKLKKSFDLFTFEQFNSKIPLFNQKLSTTKNTKMMMRQITRVKETFNERIKSIEEKVGFHQINPIKYNQKQYQQLNGQVHQSLANPFFCDYLTGRKPIQEISRASSNILIQNISQLRNMETQLKNLFDSIQRSLTISKKSAFTFSPVNKHPGLQINQQRFICKTSLQNDGNLHIGVFRQPFSVFSNKVTIRLNKIAQQRGIMLGVCLLDVVKANDYFKCRKIGQGTYGIFLTKKKWLKMHHHSNQMICETYSHCNNKQSLSFWKAASIQKQGMLSKGDVITIEVIYFEEKVRFTRNYQENAIIQMPIDINKGPLYGFVGSSYHGDIFQIQQ